MPTYEYKCEACGHAFEKFQSIKAAPIRKCPNCGKMKVKKLISKGAGLIFKGSGFYITDYRSKGYTDQAKSESGGETKAQPTEAGKADAKPAASTEGSSAAKAATESTAPRNESKSEAKSAASTPSKSADSSKSDKR